MLATDKKNWPWTRTDGNMKRRRSTHTLESDLVIPIATSNENSSCDPFSRRTHQVPSKHGLDEDTHFKRLYATEPDFQELGRQDPEFGKLQVEHN
jgi:hypothetical protein